MECEPDAERSGGLSDRVEASAASREVKMGVVEIGPRCVVVSGGSFIAEAVLKAPGMLDACVFELRMGILEGDIFGSNGVLEEASVVVSGIGVLVSDALWPTIEVGSASFGEPVSEKVVLGSMSARLDGPIESDSIGLPFELGMGSKSVLENSEADSATTGCTVLVGSDVVELNPNTMELNVLVGSDVVTATFVLVPIGGLLDTGFTSTPREEDAGTLGVVEVLVVSDVDFCGLDWFIVLLGVGSIVTV